MFNAIIIHMKNQYIFDVIKSVWESGGICHQAFRVEAGTRYCLVVGGQAHQFGKISFWNILYHCECCCKQFGMGASAAAIQGETMILWR